VRIIERVNTAEKVALNDGQEFDINTRMRVALAAQAAEQKRSQGWIRPARAHYLNGRRVILSSVRKF
jgi:protein-disulfide isomerase-like protein with CxxC motif